MNSYSKSNNEPCLTDVSSFLLANLINKVIHVHHNIRVWWSTIIDNLPERGGGTMGVVSDNRERTDEIRGYSTPLKRHSESTGNHYNYYDLLCTYINIQSRDKSRRDGHMHMR